MNEWWIGFCWGAGAMSAFEVALAGAIWLWLRYRDRKALRRIEDRISRYIIVVLCLMLCACGYDGPEPGEQPIPGRVGEVIGGTMAEGRVGEGIGGVLEGTVQGVEVTATVPYAHTSGMDNEAYAEPEGRRVIPPPGKRD